MTRFVLAAVLGLLAVGLVAPVALSADARELCLVCHVKEGATEPEVVKASRTHDGVRYGFCSEACAKAFDADPAAYVVPSLPRPAPELAVADLTGKAFTWSGLEGQVVLVDFWATWCAPCRTSMPELQALHEKYRARGFTVLGISIDDAKTARKVKTFVTKKKITYPIAVDSGKEPAWERFKVKAVPAAFLVDQKGRIVAQWTGAPADTRELEAKIGALLPRAD